jgi:hypothetical protein
MPQEQVLYVEQVFPILDQRVCNAEQAFIQLLVHLLAQRVVQELIVVCLVQVTV